MSTYDLVRDLPIQIDSYKLEPLKQEIPGGMVRHTTVVHLSGRGHTGMGEDVTYGTPEQLAFQKHGSGFDLSGNYTINSFSEKLKPIDMFTDAPDQPAYRQYRRWAFESAALVLALKQADTDLSKVLKRPARPLTFVSSLRLGKPSSSDPLKDRLRTHPTLRFKLDPINDWTDDLIAELAKTNTVDVVDLKGFYKGTPVDVETDPKLYDKICKAFPKAIIEDPDINDETRPILEPHIDRISFDAPIHSVEDIKSMPYKTRFMNMKPSRFGSIQKLFDAYDYCGNQGIKMYGGGQFELGVGRRQIQYLAAIFHPGTPNDVAPAAYNMTNVPADAPASPLIVEKF